MFNRDYVLQLVRMKGPIIPSQISKEIEQNIMMTSAILSEISSKKLLKVSYLKIGGTPLYYLPGQEAKLQNFSNKLGEKEKKAYDFLREKKIISDEEITPLIRVSLTMIKDFAIPLKVTIKDKAQIFWKWYLVDDEEASALIRDKVMPTTEKVKEVESVTSEKVEVKEVIKEEASKVALPKPVKEETSPLEKTETEQKETPQEEPKIVEEQKKETPQEEKKPKKKRTRKKTKKKEKQEKIIKEEPKIVEEQKKEKKSSIGDFFQTLNAFFRENKINIIEKSVIKHDAEFEFLLEIPSAIGKINYFCKAKSQKRVNDGELSTLFYMGQAKKLPVLFLTTGALTKKAETLLNTELKGLTVKKI